MRPQCPDGRVKSLMVLAKTIEFLDDHRTRQTRAMSNEELHARIRAGLSEMLTPVLKHGSACAVKRLQSAPVRCGAKDIGCFDKTASKRCAPQRMESANRFVQVRRLPVPFRAFGTSMGWHRLATRQNARAKPKNRTPRGTRIQRRSIVSGTAREPGRSIRTGQAGGQRS